MKRPRTPARFTPMVRLALLAPLALAAMPAARAADSQQPQDKFVYKTVGQRKLALEMDYPADWKPSDKRPAIVFFFGGGWTSGSPVQFRAQADYFAKRGLVCARADYRLRVKDSVSVNKCVEDARSAMRWVRGHAAELGIDPDRIVASGGSAGGHLAACTFFADEINAQDDNLAISPKPNAMILYNPVLDITALKKAGGLSRLTESMDDKTMQQISPLLLASKNAPPTLFIDGTKDQFNAEIRAFIAKSKQLGAANVDGYFVEGQPHGFFNRAPWQEKTTLRADEFLRSIGYLGDEPKAVFQSRPAGEGPGGAVRGKNKDRPGPKQGDSQ